MGAWFGLFFGEQDSLYVKEIAKLHHVDTKVVEKHYKEMLEAIKNETKE